MGGENVLWRRADLMVYEYDASLDRGLPDAVVFPQSTDHVSGVVRACVEHRMPFIARGSGTNLSGCSIAPEGGVIIETSRMNRILAVNPLDEIAAVQPGVFNLDLQQELARHGYWFAPDPASQKVSTLGGNIAENSGGPHGVKYGVTTNHVLGLRVVMPDGEVVDVGGAAENTPGYDLRGLLIGSEGTLGIVTEILVRIRRLPERVKTLLAVYDSIEESVESVSAIVANGIVPATLEMMDQPILKAVEDSYHCGYPVDAAAVLIIELDGLCDDLDEQARVVEKLCRAEGARDVRVAADAAERERLWAGRRGAFGAVARICRNYLVMDGTVPRTKLPKVLQRAVHAAHSRGLKCGNVFHAGDGNLHPLIFILEGSEEELRRVREAGAEIIRICLEAEGTISGEHGIGVEKLDAMRAQFSEVELATMWRINKTFDPLNLCNPGKLLPPLKAELEPPSR